MLKENVERERIESAKVGKMRKLVFIITALSFVMTANAQKVLIDGTAAEVNQHIITIGDIMKIMEPVRQQLLKRYSGEELRLKLQDTYTQALNTVLDKYLILDAYEKQDEKIPDKALEQKINEIIQDLFKGNRADLIAALAREGMAFEDWREEMHNHIIISSMRGLNVEQNIRIAPGRIRAAYDKDKEKFRMPGEIKLHSIMRKRGDSKEEAEFNFKKMQDIRNKLDAGHDFAKLAKEFSQDIKAAEGGAWGWVNPKILDAELVRTVSGIKPQKVSDIIQTEEGFHIIMVEEIRDSYIASFEDVQSQIEKELRVAEADVLYKAWINRLKEKAYIKIYDVNF
jgi:parvulin-like peptidyl-prolyl isomerase